MGLGFWYQKLESKYFMCEVSCTNSLYLGVMSDIELGNQKTWFPPFCKTINNINTVFSNNLLSKEIQICNFFSPDRPIGLKSDHICQFKKIIFQRFRNNAPENFLAPPCTPMTNYLHLLSLVFVCLIVCLFLCFKSLHFSAF